MTSAATSPEFIRFVAETYKDDLTGYRQDILGRKPNPATVELERSIVKNKRTAAGTGHGIGKTAGRRRDALVHLDSAAPGDRRHRQH
jgi:hypothetical protein